MNVSPDDDLYAVVNESAGDSVIYRVAATPSLSIVRSGGTITLSWPATAAGFNLQQSDQLTPGMIPWADAPDTPQEADGRKSVSRSSGTGSVYFRLRKVSE